MAKRTPINELEAHAIFAYIISRIKQCLFEGYSFSIPSFGTFLRKHKQIYWLPSQSFEETLKTGKGLYKLDIVEKGRRVRRKKHDSLGDF